MTFAAQRRYHLEGVPQPFYAHAQAMEPLGRRILGQLGARTNNAASHRPYHHRGLAAHCCPRIYLPYHRLRQTLQQERTALGVGHDEERLMLGFAALGECLVNGRERLGHLRIQFGGACKNQVAGNVAFAHHPSRLAEPGQIPLVDAHA